MKFVSAFVLVSMIAVSVAQADGSKESGCSDDVVSGVKCLSSSIWHLGKKTGSAIKSVTIAVVDKTEDGAQAIGHLVMKTGEKVSDYLARKSDEVSVTANKDRHLVVKKIEGGYERLEDMTISALKASKNGVVVFAKGADEAAEEVGSVAYKGGKLVWKGLKGFAHLFGEN